MERFRSYLPVGVAVMIGILLQLLFIWADSRDTPAKAAVRFVKAYYRLDPSMRGLLCEKTGDTTEGDVVEAYIRQVGQEAGRRGFSLNYMKQILYDVETRTERIDDATAKVRITAKRRTAINPVYAWIARLFRIGETRKLDEVLTVVKEDGRWKVCGNPLSIVQTYPDAPGYAG